MRSISQIKGYKLLVVDCKKKLLKLNVLRNNKSGKKGKHNSIHVNNNCVVDWMDCFYFFLIATDHVEGFDKTEPMRNGMN